ncbi:MAG: hypothetical protein EA379_08365 [Phycisphaerales bacterium]|nr:MAG: hypothetical protein EA379_08365 [Phycisphaerales bacterium]
MPRHMDPRNRKHPVEGVRLTDSELDELRRRLRAHPAWWGFLVSVIVVTLGVSAIWAWIAQSLHIAPNRTQQFVAVGCIGALVGVWTVFADRVMVGPVRRRVLTEMGLLDQAVDEPRTDAWGASGLHLNDL